MELLSGYTKAFSEDMFYGLADGFETYFLDIMVDVSKLQLDILVKVSSLCGRGKFFDCRKGFLRGYLQYLSGRKRFRV
jgi:hypothetical protein